jgi:hypothetical protein
MSFLQRAKDAASQAADQARQASEGITDKVTDRETQDKVKGQVSGGFGVARRGMKTAIERIDPGTLAEVVIKATALQEMANRALREKGSPYRIAEITISATIPPGVSFTIGRQRDPDEPSVDGTLGTHSSTELLAAGEPEETILSLAGDADDDALLAAAAELVDAVPSASEAGGPDATLSTA